MKKLSILLLSACTLSLLACASACQKKPSDNSSSSQSSQESTSATPDTPIKYTFKVLAGNRAALSESNLFITVYDQENKKVAALGLDDSGERTKQLLPDVYTVYLEDENGEKLYSTVTTARNDEPILLYWMQEASSGAGKMNEQYQIGEGYYNVPLAMK